MLEEKPWLAQYPKEIPKSIEYGQNLIPDYLKESARKYPMKNALHFMGTDLSYQKLYEHALQFAHYLKGIGVEKGDRVAIMLPNLPQGVIA